MANFLREKRGLRCVGQDRGDGSFDKGGPVSHQKVLDSILFRLYDTMYLCP